MRRCLTLFVLLLCYSHVSAFIFGRGHQPSQKSVQAISQEEAHDLLEFLAADSLLGRDTPSAGLDAAAEYIAKKFAAYGLDPIEGSYFQTFHMNRIWLGDSNQVVIRERSGLAHDLAIKKEFMPYGMTADGRASGQIVFVGYGISAPELNYDDYQDLDVSGKIVFALKQGPRQNDPSSPFYNQMRQNTFIQVEEKVRVAIEHGAVGILLATDPLNNRLLTPKGFPWPSLYKGFPMDAVPLTLADLEKEKIPGIQVGDKVIELLFGSVDALKKIQAGIDSTMRPNSFSLDGLSAFMRTSTILKQTSARNVVGVRQGRDARLKDEWVVLGAHYDHVGYRKNAPAGQDSISNGADDNASGTAGLLLNARAFCQNDKNPKRSVLFIAFAGEEKGLFGSQAYVGNPLEPLANTVTMLNMDMIGRNSADSVSVGGTVRSPELKAYVERANKKTKMILAYNIEADAGRSDQAPFMRKDIPYLFFHSGMHDDYHKVSDSIDKINFHKLSRIAQLCYRTAWHAANERRRPGYIRPPERRTQQKTVAD